MPIRIGLDNLKRRFIGNTEINKVFQGAVLLYRSITDFINGYTLRVIEDGGNVENPSNAITLMQELRNRDVFQDATFVMIPSGAKSGRVYSELNSNGDLTFTRASTATRVNSAGLIESVATGVPRIDYSSGVPSLLLEPQRTNLVLRSEEFDNASWTKNNVTINTNSIVSPNGINNASKVTVGSNNGTINANSVSVTSGTTYTISVFAKSGNTDFIQLTFGAAGFGSGQYVNFNLANGTISSSSGIGGVGDIIPMGNGWYRCSWSFAATVSTSTPIALIIPSRSNSLRTSSIAGDFVYIWGAQAEQGSYATSYIPTTTATVTRISDSYTRNNVFTNNLISSQGGTWFVELVNNVPLTRDAAGGGITLTSGSNNFEIRNPNTPNSRALVIKTISGVQTTLHTLTSNISKLVIKWNGTTADIFENGVKVVSATSFTPTVLENYNCTPIDAPRNIKQMALWNKPLTDAQCVSLTQ